MIRWEAAHPAPGSVQAGCNGMYCNATTGGVKAAAGVRLRRSLGSLAKTVAAAQAGQAAPVAPLLPLFYVCLKYFQGGGGCFRPEGPLCSHTG
jgi:hypothetical protein